MTATEGAEARLGCGSELGGIVAASGRCLVDGSTCLSFQQRSERHLSAKTSWGHATWRESATRGASGARRSRWRNSLPAGMRELAPRRCRQSA